MTLRVDDFGSPAGGSAAVDVQVDGHAAGTQMVQTGRDAHLEIPITHAGENVIELSAKPGPAELTLREQSRGRRRQRRARPVACASDLRRTHASERVWRNLLKSDPSVDLVHFTILRPPDKAGRGSDADQRAFADRLPDPELFGRNSTVSIS